MTDTIAHGIISVHNVGMPWWVTIPVVAATVNFTIRLPIQLYAQKIRNERHKLQPLAYAWSTTIRREAEQKIQMNSMTPAEQMKERREAWKRLGGVYKKMYKEFDCQTWKSFIPWVSMVPFVAFADAMRKIAGVSAFSGFQTPIDLLPSTETAMPPEPLELSDQLPVLDQSLLDGGLLWFSDLSAADPYCMLPLACMAVLGAQVWPKANVQYVVGQLLRRDPEKVETGYGKLQGTIQRAVILMPFFPLLWLNLPSAVVLYALTTFSFNALNSYLAVKVFPKPRNRLGPITKVADTSPFLHSGQIRQSAGSVPKDGGS